MAAPTPATATTPDSAIELPGFGLPLDKRPNTYARYTPGATWMTIGVPTAIEDWQGDCLTVRERKMLAFMDQITDKPEWRRKVFDDNIVAKWLGEALALPDEQFSAAMFNYCIDELRDKAGNFKDTGMVFVYDTNAAVVKSDSMIPASLQKELREAVRPLEEVPDVYKDWHPGSNDKVLDLVHPSLFPLVYGRSRILPEGKISLHDCMEHTGRGEVVPEEKRNVGEWWSKKYQWLPCDVEFSEDGSAKIASYINNLHPVHHKGLYPIIEKFIEKSVPLWEAVIDRTERLNQHRIDVDGSGYDQDLEEMEYPRQEDDPGSDDDQYWEIEDEWKRNNRALLKPDPDQYNSPTSEKPPYELLKFAKEHGLQVIVKLANIHLTPDDDKAPASPGTDTACGKNVYPGGSWHVEGMLNEHICATALYYYDEENITSSHLGFRQGCDHEEMLMKPPQSDYEGLLMLYDIEQEGPAIQEIGRVLTREGRLLAFPNVMQHRVAPFELVDKTKPGHRKILALFLVDPSTRVISTANIPPQQRSWWAEEARKNDRLSHLPAETFNNVVENVTDFPMSLEDAKEIRLDLMEERKRYTTSANSSLEQNTFFFCEH